MQSSERSPRSMNRVLLVVQMESAKKSVLWMLQSALQQEMDQHFSNTKDELVFDWGAVGGVRVFFKIGCEKTW